MKLLKKSIECNIVESTVGSTVGNIVESTVENTVKTLWEYCESVVGSTVKAL